jgi:hypothetical protein
MPPDQKISLAQSNLPTSILGGDLPVRNERELQSFTQNPQMGQSLESSSAATVAD